MVLNYCTECKNALCCKDVVLPVELTLGDIYRVAKHFNEKIHETFDKFCSFSPEVIRDRPAIRPIISFDNPCTFLKNHLCEIHSNKPLSCLKFPAYAKFEAINVYSDYSCVSGPPTPEERQYLNKIYEMASSEFRTTQASLFNKKVILLEIKNWPKEIIEKSEKNAEKINKSNLSESEKNRQLVTAWYFDIANAMKNQDLPYTFIDINGRERIEKIRLWQYCLQQIKNAEKNKGTTNQLEFFSRKYYELRKTFG